MNRLLILTILFTWSANTLAAEVLDVQVTQDNSIVLVDGEWTENAGNQGRIRIKGNQHLVAMAFDVSAIRGKRVKTATLICRQGEQAISGITLSTIATPWDELKSNGLTAGMEGMDGWGYPGAKFPAVMGGNAHTLVANVPSRLQDGAYHWNVPADMVQALTIGVAHGLAIHEHDADYSRNPTIFAREQSGKKPVLRVELSDEPEPAPQPPTQLQATPVDSRQARLTWTPAENSFAWEVLVDGHPVGRHNIPLAVDAQGAPHPAPSITACLRDLPESITRPGLHEIQVIALNRIGQRSRGVHLHAPLFQKSSLPQTAVKPAIPSAKPIAQLAVIPLTDKYDQSGQPIGDLPPDYRSHNSLFDGQRVSLAAAAGEVTGFQLLIRGQKDISLAVQLDDPAFRIDLYQALYLPAQGRMIPDPLLPLPKQLKLQPDKDQSVFVDLYVPFDAQAGKRSGSIRLSDGRTVAIELTVLPFALPKRATFFCEMNSYGLPDHVNDFYALQQVAYDHRVHANILYYSHHTAAPGARKTNLDMRLPSGKRMDNRRYDGIEPGAKSAYWDDFATAFGPYLDGSLFQNGHRGPIPAPGFYLSFHESWPLNCRAYFDGNPDAYAAFQQQPVYGETYVNILKDFARLAESKGWTETGFQVYFNNKGSLNEKDKAPWILDEPTAYWDYRALQYYGELTDQGRTAHSARIDYRIDISRPEFCRGQLHSRGDLWVVSTWAFQNYRRLVTDRLEQDGLKCWVYGTSNHVHESNRNITAWALDAWRYGATGIVPWQTVNKDASALKRADQLGLLIYDQDETGKTVVRHSARLKAYRTAQQLIEYLNLLKSKRGWSDEQLRELISQYVRLDAEVRKTSEDDAGTTGYGRLNPVGLETLPRVVAKLLSETP